MASTPTVTFDGTNINTFGAYLNADVEGWLDAPSQDYATASFVGAIGGVVSRYPTTAPRRLRLPIRVIATAIATRETYEQSLKAYLTKDVVVKLDDGTTAREITGRCVAIPLVPYKVPVTLVSDGSIVFVCSDPPWRAPTSTTATITARVGDMVSPSPRGGRACGRRSTQRSRTAGGRGRGGRGSASR